MAKHPTLFNSPIKTLYYFSIVLANYARDSINWMIKNWIYVSICSLPFVLPRIIKSPFMEQVDNVIYFMAYWIILGVASSVGLGTGLHTFVLYLGPHIAKITLYSYECNGLPVYIPSKYNVSHFECPKNVTDNVTFLQILMEVQFEAFLWGLGTAIGELPPYFVARAAALSHKSTEELDELNKIGAQKSLIDKIKLLIYNQLQKHAFLTVLLCASIPNPLFDLAGITCGHFLIPFATFFGATSIGKAIIKVHIQMLFVIFVFSEDHVLKVVSFIENTFPFFKHSLTQMLEKQKNLLKDPSQFQESEKPLFAQLWDYFIILMILYFVVSIINSLVAQYLENKSNKDLEKKSKKQQ